MKRRYVTVDVFTAERFAGNPLAVVLDAGGLDTARMQRIAVEFNYAETTFVLPPLEAGHTAQVRIFTPGAEMPFAGHPNVGTAVVLAREGGYAMTGTDRTVIATLGDGAYMFCNPSACHQVASAYGLPVLTIVCNNGKWGAVEQATMGMYRSGSAGKAPSVPLSGLSPSPAFEMYCEASGGYGEKVTEREQLPAALARALKVVRDERRQALLNVICD